MLADATHEASGMLPYARTDEGVRPDGAHQMSGNQIGVRTLNLGLPFDGIRRQLDTMAIEHFSQEAIAV